MNTIYVNCNTKGIIPIGSTGQIEEYVFVLLDEHNIPIARYQFENRIDLEYIEYYSDSSRIHFNHTPKMKYEIVSS